MRIKPIKTEADYDAALKEIERMFDAAPGTREGDRLEVLTTLVEAYEEKHFRIPLPDPIEAILYYIETRGIKPGCHIKPGCQVYTLHGGTFKLFD